MSFTCDDTYVYLDYAATAPLTEEVAAAMAPYQVGGRDTILVNANANSLHTLLLHLKLREKQSPKRWELRDPLKLSLLLVLRRQMIVRLLGLRKEHAKCCVLRAHFPKSLTLSFRQ